MSPYEKVMADEEVRELGYEPTRKGWVGNRMSKQLNGQLSLLEAKRWSPATVVAYLQLPSSIARTYAVSMALGNGISREGGRASFRGGRDQVATVISGTKRKRICAVMGVTSKYYSDFARTVEKRYVGHRCEWGVLCLWVTPFMESCPGCEEEFPISGITRKQIRNQQEMSPQSAGNSVPISGDAIRDGKGDAS